MAFYRILLLPVLAGTLALPARSQDAAPVIGGFESHGSITAGYRFTDVAGRRQKFDELFSLRDGFRVHTIDWFGRSAEAGTFADTISLSSTGLGGDPYSATTLRIRKNGVWEAGASHRQSYYYWDRNDAAMHPSGQSGLTSNHDFATVRRLGSADFSVYLTPDVRVSFEYDRTRREGMRLTTRAIEYFDPLPNWGSFARANPYVVEGPADEVSNRFTGGVTWSPGAWTFFYRAGYQRYEEKLEIENIASGQRSINVDEAATADELLDVAHWSESRRYSAPSSEFSYNGTIRPGFRIRGGYLYYRHSGPSSVDAMFEGTARADRTGTVLEPYMVTMRVEGDLAEPSHVIDQGFTLDLLDRLAFHADYRYARFTVESEAHFESTDADGPASATEELGWEQGTHTLDVALEVVPRDNLLVRPGIRLIKRDVTFSEDGIADALASRPSKIASPILSVYYRPMTGLTIQGDVRNTTNGGPYTRVTPRTDFGGRGVVRYSPTDWLALENSFRFRNADYTTTGYENRIRMNSTSISVAVSEEVSLTGGFTYDSYIATAGVEFLRGTEPREVTWRDQTVNRIWQAGLDLRLRPWVRLGVGGSYVRTTGAGEISGEAPVFGPLTWPTFNGTAEFEMPRGGTLAIDLQRTYYIEELVQGDNFSANILGLRWTAAF